ncbi:uncharacterized protein LOC122378238 [Amphibalanus amphitrite]|uniref:uncharacterized protein LOC122378238 n=1 Tax=Amphibalanus amphitrite TaxID=1232801 RepID=UPI001C913505|nr:uncharacterized protein LOC122378238 [Amphibalanus amphitrite]
MGTCLSKVIRLFSLRSFSFPVQQTKILYGLPLKDLNQVSAKDVVKRFDCLPASAYDQMKISRGQLHEAMEKFTDGQEGMDKLRSLCSGWDDATIADVRGIFQMLDDNGDGVLDMNEFAAEEAEDGEAPETCFMDFECFMKRTYDMAQDWTDGGKNEVEVNLVETFLMFAQHDERGTQYSLNDLKNLFYVNNFYVRKIRSQSIGFQIQNGFI